MVASLKAPWVCIAADQFSSVRSLLDDNKEIVKAAIARATARQKCHVRDAGAVADTEHESDLRNRNTGDGGTSRGRGG